MERRFFGLFAIFAGIVVTSACVNNSNGQTNSAAHGSRCFTDYDCMSGQVCSKGHEMLGECSAKGAQAAPASAPANTDSKQATAPKGGASGKTQNTTPEPLPPPKPPKDAQGSDFSP